MKKLFILLMLSLSVPLASAASKALNEDEIRAMLEARFPGASIEHVAPSEINSLYSFVLQGDLYYISDDGKYLIDGKMLDISTEQIRNVSQERITQLDQMKSPMRKREMAKVKDEDLVIFKAPNEKYVINVFTDIDCGYCQKMHRERNDYLSRGITIRYLAFPRAGLNSSSAKKLEGIWCAKDQQTAMTEAKLERKYREGNCKTPFAEQMSLVRKFGIRGTPGIVLENGDLIGGYLPAEIMRQRLDQLKKEQKAEQKKTDLESPSNPAVVMLKQALLKLGL
ncbi:thioredoxin fold domain-containing protein [Kangiella sp.]|uniref:thioredoxin fold domain-containing protein n=1 Tax=Kangiella sp. TaxID=1920245 RepID=UPI00199A53F6|nr:thioredoxin fold domain-containing protein [Kangiella sp.]MBD3652489.1 thioredoxin fold domain-containing protein [Kangiella sp.]